MIRHIIFSLTLLMIASATLACGSGKTPQPTVTPTPSARPRPATNTPPPAQAQPTTESTNTPTNQPTDTPTAGPIPAGATQAQLIHVTDGDTIDVRIAGTTETVRYIGIDTPERGQPDYRAATEANRALLGAGPLYLVRDQSNRDAFGRLLRYVYTSDGTHRPGRNGRPGLGPARRIPTRHSPR